MASTVLLNVTGLRTPCCLSPFVLFCILGHNTVTDAAVESVVGKCSLLPPTQKTGLSFWAYCKLKDPSEGIGEKKRGSVMRALKQHMLLPCTSALKTGFYFTLLPSIAHSTPPLLNSHLPIFGKSLSVFDKNGLKWMWKRAPGLVAS